MKMPGFVVRARNVTLHKHLGTDKISVRSCQESIGMVVVLERVTSDAAGSLVCLIKEE